MDDGDRRLLKGLMREWSMFVGRAEQVVLISLLSTGDARGISSILRVCWFVVKDVAIAGCTSICFELCCLIVGESFFPAYMYPAERCALNGKVKVMLLTMCSQLMSCTRLHSEKDVSETQHQRRA